MAARLLQEYLQQNGHDMKFAVDKATGMTIVRIAELLHQELRQSSVDVRV